MPSPEYTAASATEWLKPNIPKCWTPEPTYTVSEPTNSEEVNENA